jgi:hypothetical protein
LPLLAIQYRDVGACHDAPFLAPSALIQSHCYRFVGFDTCACVEEVSETREAISIAESSTALESREGVREVASFLSGVPDVKEGPCVHHRIHVPRVPRHANVFYWA